MANSSDDEDTTPPHGMKLAHVANRGLMAAVCNLLMDGVEHQRALKALIEAIRDASGPVDDYVIHNLADEIRRDATRRLERAQEVDDQVKAKGA